MPLIEDMIKCSAVSRIAGKSITYEQVTRCEVEILKALGWSLHHVTV